MGAPVLYLVIPCYNEEKVLPMSNELFLFKMNSLIENGAVSHLSRILYVDDGSKDATWDIICDFAANIRLWRAFHKAGIVDIRMCCWRGCLFQIQDASLANYTDCLRYQQDKMVAHDIHRELQRQECGGLPVILYGEHSSRYFIAHKFSEVSGHSIFEWTHPKDHKDSTDRGLLFMRALGYDYASTDDEALIQKARLAAEAMVDYPQPGFVQNLGDVVVVRLSETSYKADTE